MTKLVLLNVEVQVQRHKFRAALHLFLEEETWEDSWNSKPGRLMVSGPLNWAQTAVILWTSIIPIV